MVHVSALDRYGWTDDNRLTFIIFRDVAGGNKATTDATGANRIGKPLAAADVALLRDLGRSPGTAQPRGRCDAGYLEQQYGRGSRRYSGYH
jgi:hypothetical protein